ncbi:MAG: Blue-light-activated protein [Pseudomonas citronellolis]|nr:MAG: Blue-light-activated protein [Pseudomonas citronellolis]
MDRLVEPLSDPAVTADLPVARLLPAVDWSASPLGPPGSWSVALRTLMNTVLPVKAQIVLFWGPQYVALYNDAYAPTIGAKHPHALGRPGIEHWRELWDDLEPLLRGVRETGETFVAQDRPFYIERHGRGETVYFDVSYSAVRETDGSIGGVLCIVTETTRRVQFERRQAFLLELGRVLPAIAEPERLEAIGLARLVETLGARRASFGEDCGDDEHFVVRPAPTWPARDEGTRRYRDYGDDLLPQLLQGRSMLREDGLPGRSQGALLQVPVLRHAALEALLTIEFERPRAFSADELSLAEEAAQLIWLWVDHARAEQALRASSAQLTAMFDQASAGIAMCDAAGRFSRVNDRYCEIVGRPREVLLGLRLEDITHPGDQPAQRSLCQRHLPTAAPFDLTQRYLRPDGEAVWVQDQITPLIDSAYTVTGLLCVSVDISPRIAAEAELRELNESLEARVDSMLAQRESALAQLHEARKMEMIGQLTGGIAHDFNNLLTPIMGSLELIRRRLDDERSTRLVDGALQAADRARILVGRLLTFARRQTLKPQAVALHELVDEMRDLMLRSLGPTIEVAIDIPPSLPAVIVDPHQMELAILNLAVNARDAMAGGGRLGIDACSERLAAGALPGVAAGSYVRLSVSDNGCGMDSATLQRCVEPFFSTKGVGKGTGLGLSMVQGLAAQSGGGFTIDSQREHGTRVNLWLPSTDGVAASVAGDTPEAPMAPRPTHILLVDDEELVRQTTALLLRDLGYQVSDARSAAVALRLVEAGLVPDVLVTDQIMAEQTGAQLAEILRQRLPHLPVLIISGYANLSPEQLCGFEVLSKPFRRNELADRLAQLIDASG